MYHSVRPCQGGGQSVVLSRAWEDGTAQVIEKTDNFEHVVPTEDTNKLSSENDWQPAVSLTGKVASRICLVMPYTRAIIARYPSAAAHDSSSLQYGEDIVFAAENRYILERISVDYKNVCKFPLLYRADITGHA